MAKSRWEDCWVSCAQAWVPFPSTAKKQKSGVLSGGLAGLVTGMWQREGGHRVRTGTPLVWLYQAQSGDLGLPEEMSVVWGPRRKVRVPGGRVPSH